MMSSTMSAAMGKPITKPPEVQADAAVGTMTLKNAEEGKEYIIREIAADDEELSSFLFTLGCYSGEAITVVKRRRSGCTVSIKDARYNIDNSLAEAIRI